MKKILKITFGLVLVFTMVFGIGALTKSTQTTQAFSTSYVCAETQEDKQSGMGVYFKENIMPYVTSMASGFVIILIGLMPAINKMLDIAKDLKNAKETLKDSEEEKLKYKKDIEELKEQNAELIKDIKILRDMVKLGFCNTKELVVNGYANEIAKVGKQDEENEK